MKTNLKQYLSIQPIGAYTENGRNITASQGRLLYRIDYRDAVKNHHSRSGDFGSMSTFDGLDAAKELMLESHTGALIRLGIPTLVFEAKPGMTITTFTTEGDRIDKYYP